jgi:hypothetical protein
VISSDRTSNDPAQRPSPPQNLAAIVPALMPRGLWATRGPSIGTSVKLHATDLVAGLVRACTLASATLRAIPAVTVPAVRSVAAHANEAIICGRRGCEQIVTLLPVILFPSTPPPRSRLLQYSTSPQSSTVSYRAVAGGERSRGVFPLNLPIGLSVV